MTGRKVLPNMQDYKKEYDAYALRVPERFSFPLDVFDRWGERTALFWTDGLREERYSFADMRFSSSKGAGALKKIGLLRGDKVLVMLPGIPQWWEVMLSLMRLGAVPVPATTLLSAKDIEYRLSATDIKAVIAVDDDAPKVEDAINGLSFSGKRGVPLTVLIGKRQGWHDYLEEREVASPFEGERVPSNEAGLIYFTSGTTGPPKIVLHTQASYALAHLTTGRFWLDLRPGDLHWNLSDPGWAKAAWSSLFGPWHVGATIFSFYRKGKFAPSLVAETMARYPITTFCGPPTAYRMMVKELPDTMSRFETLRHFVAAGEPLNKEIIETWKERTGFPIYDGYGQTETVNLLANFRCLPIRPGSMGLPVPGYGVDIVDPEGRSLPPEVEGDIVLKVSPERPVGLFREYLGNTEATKRTMRGEWYVTGDRAYKDEDGYFWFVGRSDDIILTSGYRIGPFEVESVLIEHPAVKESAVVASPDELRGEVVKAFIVLTKDHKPDAALEEELKRYVKERTAPYKYPRKIEFVDDLPKTVSGKIRRSELKRKEFGKG
jgi:acyl-coenzyme A synthetase/AMP-(fatty) acid ligase